MNGKGVNAEDQLEESDGQRYRNSERKLEAMIDYRTLGIHRHY